MAFALISDILNSLSSALKFTFYSLIKSDISLLISGLHQFIDSMVFELESHKTIYFPQSVL